MVARSHLLNLLLAMMIIMVVLQSSASAQYFRANLDFQLGFPTGEYRDQIDKTGAGLGGEFLFAPGGSIASIGISLGWFQVGHEKRKEPFSTTIPDVTVDVNTSNNLAQFMVLLRIQPNGGPVLPYGEGLIGMNYLYTRTTIENASNGEEVASSTNLDDNAFAYGFGGGLMIRVYDSRKKEAVKPVQVFIDLKGRYIWGGEADYLREGSIRREDGEVVYDITRSKTNIVVAQIGVAVVF
jgi:hypothetical protein